MHYYTIIANPHIHTNEISITRQQTAAFLQIKLNQDCGFGRNSNKVNQSLRHTCYNMLIYNNVNSRIAKIKFAYRLHITIVI